MEVELLKKKYQKNDTIAQVVGDSVELLIETTLLFIGCKSQVDVNSIEFSK